MQPSKILKLVSYGVMLIYVTEKLIYLSTHFCSKSHLKKEPSHMQG